ncbi:vitamin H transporter [Fusarium subglutinans]|uniref:Vitamin H transporter n=1 Tax=Gibberella subglutinans TaxID=42677 RepID=A0A8H5QFC1_GIBSU|nr:vitamin H transporter [Fusarium subglutinans]KAF5613724.1 vitamin H transporter [Fusarium subglutinans]
MALPPDTKPEVVDEKTLSVMEQDDDPSISNVKEQPLVRRIDLHLMPILIAIYILQYLDKSSLNTASLLGSIQDTKLVGQEFPWLNSAFYFGYLGATYPVSVLLVKLPIAKVLAASILLWAVVLGCHVAGENFAALCSLRVLLGAFEATISPGFTLITGLWYKPSEHARRHSLWFVGNAVGSLIGSLIAYGCTFITGGPLAPWRWLFIVLGIVTAGWAVVLYIWLPDTPATTRFLNPAQRVWATQRPQVAQRSFKTNQWSNAQLLEAILDPKTWFQFLVITTVSLSNGFIANWNDANARSLLLGMPLAAYNVTIVLLSASLAERFRKSRCIIAAGASALSLVGTILVRQLPSSNSAGRYIGLILRASCANVFPMMLSLISSNVAGFTKKSTVNAVFFLGYCAGNIAGPQFFIPTEAPKYGTAFTALFVIFCILIGLILAFRQYLAWENSRRDKAQGVYIDAESPERDTMSGAVREATYETDFENKNFRYYL